MVNEQEGARNAGLLSYDRRTFQRFLHLPDGVNVVGVRYDDTLDVVEVMLEEPTLPVVDAGAIPPRITMMVGIKRGDVEW